MAEKEKNKLLECGHCCNKAPMKVVTEYNDTVEVGTPPYTDAFHKLWQILLCPVCHKPILYETSWNTFDLDFETGPEYNKKILYPNSNVTTDGLPEKVKKSYEAALSVRNIEPNAFAVLIGRTLEFICKDRKITGNNLYNKIDELAQKREIPGRFADMAHKLRVLRNIGAHADEDEITEVDVPILLEFTESILDYIYRLPAKLEKIEKRIEQKNNRN